VQGIGSIQLLHMLKANPGSEQSLPIEYLDHIVSRSDAEDLEKVRLYPSFIFHYFDANFIQLFTPIFYELATRMRDITLIGAFTPPLRVLIQLTKYKALANVVRLNICYLSDNLLLYKFINLPNWNLPKVNGRQLECSSALGPFFRLTSLPEEVIYIIAKKQKEKKILTQFFK
jgi:hypothetical protein